MQIVTYSETQSLVSSTERHLKIINGYIYLDA